MIARVWSADQPVCCCEGVVTPQRGKDSFLVHISEGFLPVGHAVAWTVAAAPFVVHGAMSVTRRLREHPEDRLLLGAAGAFTFVLSAIKLPSVTGSSSHPTGVALGSTLFRPPTMALLGAIVLLFQTLLLAHGGLTTLGANTFSMAVVGPWVAYGTFIGVRKLSGNVLVSIFCAALFASLGTYMTTSAQLALAHPGEVGFVASFGKFLSLFAITQIPLAFVEGIVTVLVFRALMAANLGDLKRLGVFGGSPKTTAAKDKDHTVSTDNVKDAEKNTPEVTA